MLLRNEAIFPIDPYSHYRVEHSRSYRSTELGLRVGFPSPYERGEGSFDPVMLRVEKSRNERRSRLVECSIGTIGGVWVGEEMPFELPLVAAEHFGRWRTRH